MSAALKVILITNAVNFATRLISHLREKAGSFQLHNTVLAIVVLSGAIAYTVLIYKLGQQSVQQTYDLPYSGIQHHGCYQRLFCA